MRRLLVPAVSTVVMLVLLVSLGIWQLHRLTWKTEILARIDAAERASGAPLDATHPSAYAKVLATGMFLGDKAALFGADVRGDSIPASGADLLTPLRRPDGSVLLVDRGWIDLARPLPPAPAGPTEVAGYIRPGDAPHWFSATDDVAGRRFYTMNPAAIAAALGVGPVLPYVLVALGPHGVPDPAQSLPRPPNDHLQYALTWFGFAVTLLIIFVLYARKTLRS